MALSLLNFNIEFWKVTDHHQTMSHNNPHLSKSKVSDLLHMKSSGSETLDQGRCRFPYNIIFTSQGFTIRSACCREVERIIDFGQQRCREVEQIIKPWLAKMLQYLQDGIAECLQTLRSAPLPIIILLKFQIFGMWI